MVLYCTPIIFQLPSRWQYNLNYIIQIADSRIPNPNEIPIISTVIPGIHRNPSISGHGDLQSLPGSQGRLQEQSIGGTLTCSSKPFTRGFTLESPRSVMEIAQLQLGEMVVQY